MKAAIFDSKSIEGVKLIRMAKPKLTRNSIICKVYAVGVNPVDAKYLIGDKLPPSLLWIAKIFVNNCVPCFDFSGIVEEANEDSGFKTGDQVYGAMSPRNGSLSEYIKVPLDQVYLKPKSLSFVESAAFPLVGLTSIQSLTQHSIRKGHNIVIIGASGGVGHVAVQIANALEIKVTAICSGKNENFVKSIGATNVVDYSLNNVEENLNSIRSKDGPFDLVLDCVHSNDERDQKINYQKMIKSSRPSLLSDYDNHNYVTLGGEFWKWFLAGVKRITGLNLFPQGYELFWVKFPNCKTDLQKLKQLAEEKRVKPVVSTIVPFTNDGVQEAFRQLRGRGTIGKVVVQIVE